MSFIPSAQLNGILMDCVVLLLLFVYEQSESEKTQRRLAEKDVHELIMIEDLLERNVYGVRGGLAV